MIVFKSLVSRKSFRGACAVLCALTAAAEDRAEEEKFPLSLDVRTDFYSAYVWRGKALDRQAVMQPIVTTTFDAGEVGSFAFRVWSNWDLSQHSGGKETRTGGGINVLNFTPSYTKTFGPLGVTVGNIWYTFPGDGYPKNSNSTKELYVTLAYKHDVVTPSLSVYYDYWGVGGGFFEDNPLKDLYARAALDKSIPITDRWRAGGTVLLGWGASRYNAVRYRSPGEGFVDYQASVFVSYAVTDAFSVGGTLAYTGLVGGAWGLDRSSISPDEIVWGGINLRWLF